MVIPVKLNLDIIKPDTTPSNFVTKLINEGYDEVPSNISKLYKLFKYLLNKCTTYDDKQIACEAFVNLISNEISKQDSENAIGYIIDCILSGLPYEHLLYINRMDNNGIGENEIIQLTKFMKETLIISEDPDKTWIQNHITYLEIRESSKDATKVPELNRLKNYNTCENNIMFINIMLNIIKYNWSADNIATFRKFINRSKKSENLTSIEALQLMNYITSKHIKCMIEPMLNIYENILRIDKTNINRVSAIINIMESIPLISTLIETLTLKGTYDNILNMQRMLVEILNITLDDELLSESVKTT